MKSVLFRLAMLPTILFFISLLLLTINQVVFHPWYEPVLVVFSLGLAGILINKHLKVGFALMGMVGCYEYMMGMIHASEGYLEKLFGGCLILYMVFLLIVEDVLQKKKN